MVNFMTIITLISNYYSNLILQSGLKSWYINIFWQRPTLKPKDFFSKKSLGKIKYAIINKKGTNLNK